MYLYAGGKGSAGAHRKGRKRKRNGTAQVPYWLKLLVSRVATVGSIRGTVCRYAIALSADLNICNNKKQTNKR